MEKELPSHTNVWNQCLEIIRDTVSPEVYVTIFEPINSVSLDNKMLTIELPSLWYKEILEEQYVDLLRSSIRKLLGNDAKLRYKVLVERGQTPDQTSTITIPSSPRKAVKNPLMMPPLDVNAMDRKDIPGPFVVPGIKKQRIPSNLSETLTFDNYVVGDCNRLAVAAGMSIAKSPGQTPFNPLFIYSEVGLGKTHLVNAIGIQTKINFPDKIVIYVSADTFYQQYMEAVKSDNLNDFYWFYQAVDMLIIDDIQFISGNKTKTQEAFFQIFNHLHQLKKQIIMTSDKSPVDITGFEPRLLNRFKWGLATDPELGKRVKVTILATGFGIDSVDGMSSHRQRHNTQEEATRIAAEQEKEAQLQDRRNRFYGGDASNKRYKRRPHIFLFRSEDLDNDDVISAVEQTPTYKRTREILDGIYQQASGEDAQQRTEPQQEVFQGTIKFS